MELLQACNDSQSYPRSLLLDTALPHHHHEILQKSLEDVKHSLFSSTVKVDLLECETYEQTQLSHRCLESRADVRQCCGLTDGIIKKDPFIRYMHVNTTRKPSDGLC